MKRVIVHPSFLNVSFKEAETALANMDQGDAIFRPSSKVCINKEPMIVIIIIIIIYRKIKRQQPVGFLINAFTVIVF